MARFLLLAIFICISNLSWAQKAGSDSLTKDEIALLNKNTRNTPWYHWAVLDSMFKKGDTLSASKELMKIDPYFFIIEGIDPARIDTYILGKYSLYDRYLNSYKDLYKTSCDSPRSTTFLEFKKRCDDDQKIRKTLEMCGDSVCVKWANRKMFLIDSANVDFLENYLSSHGTWPSYRDGAEFASTIAVHAHSEYSKLLPYLKKGTVDAKMEYAALALVLYWNNRNEVSDAFEMRIKKYEHRIFDISNMLNYELPTNLMRLRRNVREICPVSPYLIFESRTNEEFHNWVNKLKEIENKTGKNVITQLTAELVPNCPKYIYEGVWEIGWQPGSAVKPKILLYLISKKPVKK